MPISWDTLRGGSAGGNGERGGLGYRYVRDPRSDDFVMAPRLITAPEPPPERVWPISGDVLDQGQEGSCVGHGWAHWLNCGDSQSGPRQHPVDHSYALDIYLWAQNHDEWADTPPEEGTSVLAGAKACVQFQHLKEGYVWGRTIDDLISWLGNYGPVVVGSLWLTEMNPDTNGFVRPDGKIAGGHCYLWRGYKQVDGRTALVGRNSWSDEWGDNGEFYMFVEDFQRLINRGNYSLCSALELAPEPVPPKPRPEPVYRTRVNVNALARHPTLFYGKELEIVDSTWGRVTPRWIAYPVNEK